MKSVKLTLYKEMPILPAENKVIESLTDFLSTLQMVAIPDRYNYFPQRLTTSIIVKNPSGYGWATSNDFSELKTTRRDYLKVEVVDEATPGSVLFTYYYFVANIEPASEAAVRLDLLMDVLNTFAPSSLGMTPRTLVKREHRDRYTALVSSTETFSGTTPVILETYFPENTVFIGNPTMTGISSYVIDKTSSPVSITINPSAANWSISFPVKTTKAIIDPFDEGISPVLYHGLPTELEKANKENAGWNLVYSGSTGIDCHLIPDRETVVQFVSPSAMTVGSGVGELNDGKYYYFYPEISGDVRVIDGNVIAGYVSKSVNTTRGFYLHASGTAIYLKPFVLGYTASIITGSPIQKFWYEPQIQITPGVAKLIFTTTNIKAARYNSEQSNFLPTPPAGGTIVTFNNNTATGGTVDPLATYDRTTSTLLKIIALPYPPLDGLTGILANDIGQLETVSGYDYIKVNAENFSYSIDTLNLDPAYIALSRVPYPVNTESRTNKSENKIFNSAFFRPRFVYDSFGYDFHIEDVDPEIPRNTEFNLVFKVTNTVNSRFMFYFPDWDISKLKRAVEDYPGYLLVARNNERMILNSDYLNYIRTGYNYDVKSKNRREGLSILSGAAGVIGAVGSVGRSIATGNPLGVVTGAATLSNTLLNTANSIAASEDAINAKKTQLENSAVSVAGSDDIDLLFAYSGNRAFLYYYQCSERMKTAILDLFYYCGYATTEHKTPDLDSREWFNFIQADLDVSPTVNIPADCLAEILAKYSDGVTVFHKQVLSGVNTWDLDQDKENWETLFFE